MHLHIVERRTDLWSLVQGRRVRADGQPPRTARRSGLRRATLMTLGPASVGEDLYPNAAADAAQQCRESCVAENPCQLRHFPSL